MSDRRVVITGIGMVTALGNDVDTTWSRLLAGECGANEITLFDHTDYPVHFACELKDFKPTTWVDHKSAPLMPSSCAHHSRMASSDFGRRSDMWFAHAAGIRPWQCGG